ncbi:Helicase swr-1 [Coniochaeta hoffmannii]|uniref:DNA helicase n=1 Tax=Coniochaeta hoffmannii TaxID=91930 RepID=A0AA38RHN4_9PEZI|nr:Helicase swr-1 [Coniochaeta hoffmannii]
MTEIASPAPTEVVDQGVSDQQTKTDNDAHDSQPRHTSQPPAASEQNGEPIDFRDDNQPKDNRREATPVKDEHPPCDPGQETTTDPKNHDDEPPAKRRRVRDTTPHSAPRKPKVVSPPWKKVEAEGPTTFVEGGRRKSGRINTVPLEMQSGDKRITRRALHGQHSSPPRIKYASTNGHTPSTHPTPSSSSPSKRPTTSAKAPASKQPASKPPPKKTAASEPKSAKRAAPHPPVTPTKGTRRSTRHVRDNDEQPARTTPRIKLKQRVPLTVLPLVHRDQANVRPKLGPSFEEYCERAVTIPVQDGGLMTEEDGPAYTDEMAVDDARLLVRVEREVEPGGILSEQRCSVFEPEPEEEPPRQWAHMDHMMRAMANFRKLLLLEQQRHRALAKRVALACQAEWLRRNPQPKTAEDIEAEERAKSEARWRQVNKALALTWENVRIEVNKRRLAEWEAEEKRRVKAALNEAVNLSEQKLQAQQARLEEDELTDDMDDEDDEDDSMGSNDGEDDMEDADSEDSSKSTAASDKDEDMSSSSDEDDKNSVVSDEGLTQEQLRAKYANIPDLEAQPDDDDDAAAGQDKASDAELDDDTSDESVDMDDDLGSTEDESDSDDEGGSDGDGEESDADQDEPNGLLGLFFGKSELKKIEQEAAAEDNTSFTNPEVAMEDAPLEPKINGHAPEHDGTEIVNGHTETTPKEERATAPHHLTNGTDHEDKPSESIPDTGLDAKEPLADITDLKSKQNVGTHDFGDATAPIAAPATSGPEAPINDVLNDPEDDVDMIDISPPDPIKTVPDLEVIEPPTDASRPSPETDAITNAPTPSRSQSPKTSDTKPSDVETTPSGDLLETQKDDSRSVSPLPGAPKTEVPFLLRGTLREYQHYGLDWLAGLYRNNTNGILADEMGLGKTIQTIALLAHLACVHEVWGPHLVIVPTSVMLNWEMEFKKWCPGFKILTYYGNQEERKRKRQGWTNDDVWNVCITSYQMVLQDQQVFKRRRWHYMILDEAHNIKNFKSQRWQTLLGFNTHSRLLLTGTPLQNNLTELWSLLFFLMPPENGEGGFADLKEFHDWFHKPESQILESGREQMDEEARAIIQKLHKVLRPYLLRRLKADVEKQMPAKYEHVEFCRLSKRQRELYDGFLSRTETRETLSSGNYLSIINCLMQLRKVCNHPDLFVDRPIMTSFRMQRSVPSDYESMEKVVRKKLLFQEPMSTVSLGFLNMIPAQYEQHLSSDTTDRISQLSPHRILLDLREAQRARAQYGCTKLDPASVKSNLVYLESVARWGRFEELQHCVYLNALRRQQRPIYGKRLVEMLTLDTDKRPFKQRPKVPQQIMSWFEEDSFLLHNAIPTLQQRAASMETTVTKFACVTPAVVTRDLDRLVLGNRGVEEFEEWNMKLSAPIKYAPYMPKVSPPDPWHEARMRLSIQFPDKRLLQYDCGKLQALDKLLRKLQDGGHRALIFTQMTKVLDILEQFLNIHGHKYLRLDGATKVEQRQILTDRFNHDPRILCFILSTRSGGLGINLTGADTVIFYDQDWNPAMDKQCQDRCHRIGQTRDVHIYRLVSEHTIEANILRKAGQKQMLDDVVIQEGEFTTDYFNKLSVRDVVDNNGEVRENEDDVAANAAMDRILGGGPAATTPANVGRVLEQAEDTEDVQAARVAEREIQQDDADFNERTTTTTPSGVSSARQGTPREGLDLASAKPGQASSALGLFAETAAADGQDGGALAGEEIEYNAEGGQMHTIDDYMLKFMSAALEGTPLDLPKDKKKSKKKGKDTRKR